MTSSNKLGRAGKEITLCLTMAISGACSGGGETTADAGVTSTFDASATTGTEQDSSATSTDGPDTRVEPGPQGNNEAGTASASDTGTAVMPSSEASATSDASVVSDAAQPDASVLAPFEGEGQPWMMTAPRATCGAGEKPDQMIAGMNADLRCNLQIVGEVAAPHFLSLAWHDECAYVNGPDGTTVIHVDASGKPTVTTTLTDPGFRSNWESMKANAMSGLLAGYESNGQLLSVYDVAKDCKAPALQATITLGDGFLGSIGHAGSFSPDGTIYYASSMYTSTVFAVDFMNPKQPKVITSSFDRGAHDLYVGKNGTRGYFANPNVANLDVGSFAVIDLTQVQARTPNAKGTLIHEISWDDGSVSQYPILVTYRGKDFLFINDELGSSMCGDAMNPHWGYTRIFEMSDEKSPKLTALIKTEAQDPKNCEAVIDTVNDLIGFGLGTHYCNVDRLDDPRLLSCGNFDGGVRVYDIRNPWRPKEVAYLDTPTLNVPSMQRIVAEKRELWVASTSGTFYVLKFTPGSAADQILAQ